MRKYIKILINFTVIVIVRIFSGPLRYWRNVAASCVDVDFGPSVKVGRNTYGLNQETIVLAPSLNPPSVVIGSFCSIAPGVVILANADHPTNLVSTFPFRSLLYPRLDKQNFSGPVNKDVVSRGSVQIGDDVWIGQNTLILSGVNIGIGAVIGAGSVVTNDIPPYAIAVGNPARVIRFRFPPETIDLLLKSEWWTLSDEKLRELEPFFYGNDINGFINQVTRC